MLPILKYKKKPRGPLDQIVHPRNISRQATSMSKFMIIQACLKLKSWLSPFEKDNALSFKQTWINFTLGRYVPILVEFGGVFLEKKVVKNV